MTALLEVRDIDVRFGGLQALSGVSLDVREGEIVGLIGPNGAGKTTLFNVISGLQLPTSGSVHLAEANITHLPAHRRVRHGLGRGFQHPGLLWSESIRTNLLAAQFSASAYAGCDPLLRPRRYRRVERDLNDRAVQIARTVGIEPHLEERVSELSFGIARFVELACLLLGDPPLLLLDEPTTGLDSSEVVTLQRILEEERSGGRTVLVVAHDVGFVMNVCDTVYVLAQGSVLFQGGPSEAQQDQRVVEAYLGAPA